ncbi:diacylglycerol/lipid kinase family protein [Lentzea tibetensis]|uniref:diacylglycerol/lipid kinase family protein n=1 Tax=Lentzea tibetensis TaxID=2591470 RepID=UPI001F24487E|nr:diacylglycerol kinase family protein [Lentzea tibetensis]
MALLTFAGAVVVVVVVLLRHPVELPIALILLFATVAAAWSALVNRGLARLLAAAVAIVALVTVVLLPEIRSFLVISVVVGLVLASTAAARVAIGRDLAPVTGGHIALPARHGVLLMNPWSGGGKVGRFDLEDKARSIGVTPVVLQRGDDLRALAEQAVAGGADVLGMAGGDGSQALVADVASQHDVAFVCVPAGTRNHFALDLGLDRENVAAALDAFGPAVERRVDLALIGDRVFVNNASLGVYATVVQSEEYRDAKLATTAQRLPDLFGPGTDRTDFRFAKPDGSTARSADVVLVSNGAYRFTSMNGFGTRARMDEGLLGVVTVTVDSALDVPTLIAAEMAGQISRFRGYEEWTAPQLEIDSGQPLVDVGVDGEALRLPPPLRFRSLPGALRVRTPVDAPGAAPAALAPTGVVNVVRVLFRVLSGSSARSHPQRVSTRVPGQRNVDGFTDRGETP